MKKLSNETYGQCLKRLCESGGKCIYIDISITVDESIEIAENTSIIGINRYSTISVKKNSNISYVFGVKDTTTKFIIKNITFYGYYETSIASCIKLEEDSTNRYFQSSFIENVIIMAFSGIGIYISPHILGVTIKNVHIQYCNSTGLHLEGHDCIVDDFMVFQCGSSNGYGVYIISNNSKVSNGKVFINGNEYDDFSNVLGGTGTNYTAIEFQENKKGILISSMSSLFSIVCDKNNLLEREVNSEITLRSCYYCIINATILARAKGGIKSSIGITQESSCNNNLLYATNDGNIEKLYDSDIIAKSDTNNSIFILGEELFTEYEDKNTGGTVSYIGNGRFLINGKFSSNVNLFSSYGGSVYKTLKDVSLYINRGGDSSLAFYFINGGTVTTYFSSKSDINEITFNNIQLAIQNKEKVFNNVIIEVKFVKKSNSYISS